MTDFEKRLANTESALVALQRLLEDILPPAHQEDTGRVITEYIDANKSLGGFSIPFEGFIK